MNRRTELEHEFFTRIPKARKINPIYRAIFAFMYAAHERAIAGTKVLNIYCSADFSGNREEVYREKFFAQSEYHAINFKEDSFLDDTGNRLGHILPYADNSFDVVVTTKIILEHVSDPQFVTNEILRILKPGGEAFIIITFIRRQHQKPHDYFRFTEFGAQHMFTKAGFSNFECTYTNGFMATAAAYFYFFQRGLGLPKFLEKFFDIVHAWIIEPLFFALDRLDNGYGKDMTQYFLVRARK